MTVRTPDESLAGSLRENLPTLHARLADGGLKNAAPAGEVAERESRPTSESARSDSQDSQQQQRQEHRDSQDGDPRWPRVPQETVATKQKGKDFAWFMSTLR